MELGIGDEYPSSRRRFVPCILLDRLVLQGDEAWPDCGEAGAQRTRFLPCRNARGPRHHAPGQLCERYTVRALHHRQYHGVAQDLALTDQRSGPKPIDRWSVRGSCWVETTDEEVRELVARAAQRS